MINLENVYNMSRKECMDYIKNNQLLKTRIFDYFGINYTNLSTLILQSSIEEWELKNLGFLAKVKRFIKTLFKR